MCRPGQYPEQRSFSEEHKRKWLEVRPGTPRSHLGRRTSGFLQHNCSLFGHRKREQPVLAEACNLGSRVRVLILWGGGLILRWCTSGCSLLLFGLLRICSVTRSCRRWGRWGSLQGCGVPSLRPWSSTRCPWGAPRGLSELFSLTRLARPPSEGPAATFNFGSAPWPLGLLSLLYCCIKMWPWCSLAVSITSLSLS